MTHKPNAKILPVRYNPGKNGNYTWDLGSIIWDPRPTNTKKQKIKPNEA